jgi:hypothetical protein
VPRNCVCSLTAFFLFFESCLLLLRRSSSRFATIWKASWNVIPGCFEVECGIPLVRAAAPASTNPRHACLARSNTSSNLCSSSASFGPACVIPMLPRSHMRSGGPALWAFEHTVHAYGLPATPKNEFDVTSRLGLRRPSLRALQQCPRMFGHARNGSTAANVTEPFRNENWFMIDLVPVDVLDASVIVRPGAAAVCVAWGARRRAYVQPMSHSCSKAEMWFETIHVD